MKNEDFEPDVLLTPTDEISRHMRIYLDDREAKNAFELRVKWESFEREAFGELLVGAEENGQLLSSLFRKPRVGWFLQGNVWVRSVAGQIYVDLDERGKELLGWLKRMWQ